MLSAIFLAIAKRLQSIKNSEIRHNEINRRYVHDITWKQLTISKCRNLNNIRNDPNCQEINSNFSVKGMPWSVFISIHNQVFQRFFSLHFNNCWIVHNNALSIQKKCILNWWDRTKWYCTDSELYVLCCSRYFCFGSVSNILVLVYTCKI